MWSSLYVISDGTGKLILYADNISMVEFVKNIHSMRLEMYLIKSGNSDDVTKAAVLLGDEIKNQGATQGWSLDVEDNEATTPESWSNSCQTILILKIFNAVPLQEVACYIIWHWPALCSLPWWGWATMPHLLIFIVKSLIGNTKLVQTPHRLGDSAPSLYSARVDWHRLTQHCVSTRLLDWVVSRWHSTTREHLSRRLHYPSIW